ncbi:MAG TPA: hypothetical protein VF587_15400, partial [Solirubrobacteraceae bacterium]
MPDGTPVRAFDDAFAGACAAAPDEVVETTLSVGGRPLLLRTAGRGIAAVVGRSLAPADPSAEPVLRLDLYEEDATGVGDPSGGRLNLGAERHGPAGERFALTPDGRRVRFHGPHFDIRLDRDARRAVGWVRGASRLSSWHRARPLQTLFMPWLNDLGMTVVHAAMVAREGDGVLLAGASFAGKSTTAAACAQAGLGVLGDDAIALERTGEGFAGHCLHSAIKLRSDALERAPDLAARAEAAGGVWEGEAVLFLRDAFPESVTATARLRALAFPRLSPERESRVVPLGRGRSLATLTGAALS